MNPVVRVQSSVIDHLLRVATELPAQECCGLLAGINGGITHVLPAVNARASATAYEIAPEELFRLMREIRAAGLTMLGIYHSHPQGNNDPSRTDIENAFYPDAAYFILSPLANASRPVRAFAIREGFATELEIVIVK